MTSDATSRPRSLALGLVLLALVIMTACTDTPPLESADEPDSNPISMAEAAIGRIDPPAGSQLIVPTDSTLLGLDADTLARIARDGDVDFLLRELILSEPIDVDSLDVAPASRTTTTGAEVDFIPTESGVVVGRGRLVEVRPVGDVTYLIVDGLWNE